MPVMLRNSGPQRQPYHGPSGTRYDTFRRTAIEVEDEDVPFMQGQGFGVVGSFPGDEPADGDPVPADPAPGFEPEGLTEEQMAERDARGTDGEPRVPQPATENPTEDHESEFGPTG